MSNPGDVGDTGARDAQWVELAGGQRLLVMRAPRGRAVEAEALTPAERAVLDLLCEGRTNREIAEARGRSVNTVAKQVRGVLRKLGVSDRIELSLTLGAREPSGRPPGP